MLQAWPMLAHPEPNTIFITRELYAPMLKNILKQYIVIEARQGLGERLFRAPDPDLPVAFVPEK